MVMTLGGPQSRLGHGGEDKSPWLCLESNCNRIPHHGYLTTFCVVQRLLSAELRATNWGSLLSNGYRGVFPGG
jgi:hypothetical protein